MMAGSSLKRDRLNSMNVQRELYVVGGKTDAQDPQPDRVAAVALRNPTPFFHLFSSGAMPSPPRSCLRLFLSSSSCLSFVYCRSNPWLERNHDCMGEMRIKSPPGRQGARIAQLRRAGGGYG